MSLVWASTANRAWSSTFPGKWYPRRITVDWAPAVRVSGAAEITFIVPIRPLSRMTDLLWAMSKFCVMDQSLGPLSTASAYPVAVVVRSKWSFPAQVSRRSGWSPTLSPPISAAGLTDWTRTVRTPLRSVEKAIFAPSGERTTSCIDGS